MPDFGESPPEDTNEGINNWVVCPECLEQGTEDDIRAHLVEAHGWSEAQVNEHFGEQPYAEKVGGQSAPVSEQDTSPAYATGSATSEGTELQEAEDESDLCDCDPDYKETQVIQESTGANLGPLGGNRGDGTPVIICKKCGEQFEVTGDSDGLGPGIIWDGDGPGPF